MSITKDMENIVKEADEIVSRMKELSKEITQLAIPDDIDFLGCSSDYVIEKIDILISDLEWIKDRIKNVSKKQRSEAKLTK